MNVSKLALSPVNFLRSAIHAHKKEHGGKYPKRFELHPEVIASIRMECEPWMVEIVEPNPDYEFKLMSVPIKEDEQATKPKMINCKNEVIYL